MSAGNLWIRKYILPVINRLRTMRRVLLAVSLVLVAMIVIAPDILWPAIMGYIAIVWSAITNNKKRAVGKYREFVQKRKERGVSINALGEVVQALQQPTYIVDQQMRIVFANTKAIDIFGTIEPAMVFSLKFRNPRLRSFVERSVDQSQGGSMEYHRTIGAKSFYQVDILPIPPAGLLPSAGRPAVARQNQTQPDNAQRSTLFLVQFTNLDNLKQTEQVRSDFIANASHELRTPLASLRGFIETLQTTAKDDPDARERFLNLMLLQSERMSRLIDDLLSLSRIESGGEKDYNDRVELGLVAQHVFDSFQPLAKEHKIKFEFEDLSAHAQILGDRDELVQIIQNLIENAFKYGRKTDGSKNVVKLHLQRLPKEQAQEERARLAVIDQGPGIAQEHIPRLTERFYRVESPVPELIKGTGLGLSIVKHLVVRHRAHIDIRSELDKGTTVLVDFPMT